MKKKAQGISINTIIVAAIALIVLVVLVAIFTGNLGKWVVGITSCGDKGGSCRSYPINTDGEPGITCNRESATPLRGTNCGTDAAYNNAENKGICCIPVTT